jgi:hypothetical protein
LKQSARHALLKEDEEESNMELKVSKAGAGLYPQEVAVNIQSIDGLKTMLIDERAMTGQGVGIGAPITSNANGEYLVELPRETMNGEWRVWVNRDQLVGA